MSGEEICAEYLMESGWMEGFECSLKPGHDGPHRCEGGHADLNESTDNMGRRYSWVHEWSYLT